MSGQLASERAGGIRKREERTCLGRSTDDDLGALDRFAMGEGAKELRFTSSLLLSLELSSVYICTKGDGGGGIQAQGV